MGGPPVCSRPGIFLKASLPTKSCSKPTICMKRSLFNHGVSSFGTHAPVVWVAGRPSLRDLRKARPALCSLLTFSPASAVGSWQRLPDALARQAFLPRGWLHCLSLADLMRAQSTPTDCQPPGGLSLHAVTSRHQTFLLPFTYLLSIYLSVPYPMVCVDSFLEREEGSERERNIDRLPRLLSLTRNLGMCPERDSNPQPFSVRDDIPTN